ncbi:UDP-glucose/GDP-mannose dehydrogenase family, NAD binding domain-containing protein [Lasiosphaeria hispida]|uniref:UDP-glucose 6-dehydrogenase n=1 Tax=Lasiosphaeria hispida TaxID=260671 RepID=A0AAJ0MH03_9PEZI|nr:UDP-glucose/GDP-mannose dehydrogenase family, NAD binding domain-containing protein [Lasiosphaeria hispida]
MENPRPEPEVFRPTLPLLNNHLAQSLPSSQSIASACSPGASTPTSWAGNQWLRGTPDTSPTNSGAGSPELNPKLRTDDGRISPVVESQPQAVVQVACPVKSICFIGAGFVGKSLLVVVYRSEYSDPGTGGPTAAVIAYHNPQILVNVVDLNQQRVDAWNSRHLPIHEDGLIKVVRMARDGTVDTTAFLPGLSRPVQLQARQPNLLFSTRVIGSIEEADVVFICVNTPTKTHGLGAGSMADVSAIESATRTVAKHAKAGAIIVEKSTVPCGTARMIQDILRYHRPETTFEVLSNPEFLAEGTAVDNLMHPDRILIGSAQTLPGLRAAALLKDVYAAWVPPARIVTVNTFSSELAKLVANTMLAQRISSVNAVSAICEEIGLGADVDDVSLALGKDTRLGPKFLQAGVGFGGSCFEKDILNLAYLASELHLDVVADYWLGILRINEYQRQRYTRNIVRELNGSLRGKKIAVLGFAFKDGTNDTRNSIAVHIIKDLADEMPREIAIFDPGCTSVDILDEIEKIGLTQNQLNKIRICAGWREVVQEASAACVLTQWRQFRGRQIGGPQKSSEKQAKTTSRAVTPNTREEALTEMGILALEDLARRERSTSEDPLGRLKPLPPCANDCRHCGVSLGRSHNEDTVDWLEAAGMMQEPRWVFDGRNVVNHLELQGLGFRVRGIGKGAWMA